MAFNKKNFVVLLLGGGFSGLSALIELRKSKLNDLEIILIDKDIYHKKIIGLHNFVFKGHKDWKVLFSLLAQRFSFRFIREELSFSESDLLKWNREKKMTINGEEISFDVLLLSTGTSPSEKPKEAVKLSAFRDLNDLQARDFSQKFNSEIQDLKEAEKTIELAFLGAGANSLQFIFSLQNYLSSLSLDFKLSLWDREKSILSHLPKSFHYYILEALTKKGIVYHPSCEFKGISESSHRMILEFQREKSFTYQVDMVFSFLGVKAHPFLCNTDVYGHVLLKGKVLSSIFSAGDCSFYEGRGLNSLSAQAAVRKGRHCAKNIILQKEGQTLSRYSYRELGFALSLSPGDAVAWLINKNNIVKGFPAFLLKEALEKQYDLFLSGIDTYIPASLLSLF